MNSRSDYDIMHFEALGPEAEHLKEEVAAAQQRRELPKDYRYVITPQSVQEFLGENPGIGLPDIITTKTHSILPETYLRGAKKSIVTRSAGYDHFEHLVDKANITSLREYCVNAVAQTAVKFLYAAAGELNRYTRYTSSFERSKCGAFMELRRDTVLTVFGVGRIGKRVYELAEANGLTVQGVDVRQKQLDRDYGGTVRFVSREDAIRSSDVVVNCMNLTRNRASEFHNMGYFSKEYLSRAGKALVLINMTRGEIAPETVLLELYRSGRIRGIGLDVFTDESTFSKVLNGSPAQTEDHAAARMLVQMSLDRSGNIYVQPHQAFNSDIAAKTKAAEAIKHVVSWYRNDCQRFDEQLPYY